MRAVLTRVKSASVTIEGRVAGQIGQGFLILLGVTHEDTETQAIKLADKLTALELSKFIIARRSDHRYICEFHHVEQFLAALLTTEADVRLLEPDWLRDKLILGARRVLANNEIPLDPSPKKSK